MFSLILKRRCSCFPNNNKGKGHLVTCEQEPRDIPRLLQRTWRLGHVLGSMIFKQQEEASTKFHLPLTGKRY
jgi:hypothetical protein